MPDEAHISSLVVHCLPERAPDLAARLRALPGAEIHGGVEQGKLILVLETGGEAEISEQMAAVQSIEGVLSVALVFHHVESTGPSQASTEVATPWI